MVAVEDLDDFADGGQPGLLSAYSAGGALEAAGWLSALSVVKLAPSRMR